MTRRQRVARITTAALACLVLSACVADSSAPLSTPEASDDSPRSTASDRSPQDTASGGLPEGTVGGEEAVGEVATDLDAPWSVAFHGGTALVSERDTGQIREIGADGTARVVAVVDGVDAGGEGGLLGLAAHESHLYVYFTAADGNRIDRFEIVGEPGRIELRNGETILDGLPAARHHNGGRLAVGPDSMLYASVGDAGNTAAAQDLESLAGKILRMTPEGDVPADNPFPNSLVHSYGHRNVQGLGWDAEGIMYASEFGQDTWDELNVIEAGGNYGWPEVEGIGARNGFIDPVQQWRTSEASPSGLAVAEDSLFIVNLRGERLREVPLGDLSSSTEYFVGEYGRLRDAAVAPDGSLWVLTNNTDGRGSPRSGDDRILRIDVEEL